MSYKRYFLLVVMIGLSGRGMAQTKTQPDTLHDAELLRPLDIIQEEPRWNITSTDLFTGRISSGLYGFYGPQPKILLNGIPIDANYFGWQNLNMLPLFVNDIERAISLYAPQVYKHTQASAGAINFKTIPVDSGFSAKAFFYSGNETGDPGPWAYDSLKISPNIDRWGPDMGLSLAYGKDNWYAKGLYITRSNRPSDLAQNLRLNVTNSILGTNTEYVYHLIYVNAKNGLLKVGYDSEEWDFKTRAVFGINDDYLFLQPFGREIPVQSAYRQLAGQLSYSTGPWRYELRYMAHKKTIDKRLGLHTYIFDWSQLTHTTSFSVQLAKDELGFNSGFIYEFIQTDAPGLNHIQDVVATFYANGFLSVGDFSKLYIQNNLDFHGARIGGTVRLGAFIDISQIWQTNPQIYYSQVLPIRQNSFAYWVNRGYTFADRLGISFNNPVRVGGNELLAVRLENKFDLGANFHLKLAQQFVHHYASYIPWQQVKYNVRTHTRPGTFTVTRESGKKLSLSGTLSHSYTSLFQQSLSVQLQYTLSGSNRYKNYFKQVPNTEIQYQFDIYPVDDLILSINAFYRSPTKWVELKALEGKEYRLSIGIPIRRFAGTFHIQTPSYVNMSLSAQKWFWDRHMSMQLSIKNLFDSEVRMHTMGARLATIFYIKLSLQF